MIPTYGTTEEEFLKYYIPVDKGKVREYLPEGYTPSRFAMDSLKTIFSGPQNVNGKTIAYTRKALEEAIGKPRTTTYDNFTKLPLCRIQVNNGKRGRPVIYVSNSNDKAKELFG